MKNIKTYLPTFNGFYGSVYEDILDSTMESEIEYYKTEEGKDIDFDSFDFKDWYNRISIEITYNIEDKLKELNLIDSITFEELRSPKFYNYSNDSINCIINNVDFDKIQKYLLDNLSDFNVYLKEKYTSYDGFISSYSNDSSDWIDKDNYNDDHKLGSILDFILNMEYDDIEQYDYEELHILNLI